MSIFHHIWALFIYGFYLSVAYKKKRDKEHTPMGIQCHILHHKVLLKAITNLAFMVAIIENM
jgi:hypothetical protein